MFRDPEAWGIGTETYETKSGAIKEKIVNNFGMPVHHTVLNWIHDHPFRYSLVGSSSYYHPLPPCKTHSNTLSITYSNVHTLTPSHALPQDGAGAGDAAGRLHPQAQPRT